jgi:predicted NBD/HSP70 family sugar kinase
MKSTALWIVEGKCTMYIGLDVHKNMSYYSLMDEEGKEVTKDKFPTTRDDLDKFGHAICQNTELAIDAFF